MLALSWQQVANQCYKKNIKGFLEYVKDKFAWSQIESNGTIYSDILEH